MKLNLNSDDVANKTYGSWVWLFPGRVIFNKQKFCNFRKWFRARLSNASWPSAHVVTALSQQQLSIQGLLFYICYSSINKKPTGCPVLVLAPP